MNAEEIKEQARLLLAEEARVEPAQIRDDTVLKRLPGMGTGRVLEVIGRLERRHGLVIDDQYLYGLTTLADLERIVTAQSAPRPEAQPASRPEPKPRPAAGGAASDGELRGWLRSLEKLVPTPDDLTHYSVDRPTALALMRTDDRTLDTLMRHGLRHGDGPDGPRFDEHDLYNLAMYCGSGRSVPEVAVRYNVRLARGSVESWTRPEVWRIRHFATCPDHGRCDQRWELAPVRPEGFGGELLEVTHDLLRDGPVPSGEVAGRPAFMMLDCTVRTAGKRMELRSPVLRSAYRDALEELRSGKIRFQSVPAALRVDASKARALGVGNCVSTSMHLAQTLAHAGFQVRTRKGYFVAVGAEDHGWMEVLEDGEWKALDPALALLAEWDLGAERSAAFTEFCAGSYLNRFVPCDSRADEEVVRHWHGDQLFDEVPTTIVTRTAGTAVGK
ncbi:acyl carrier protein [Streptomyces roseochromogenus]|uniref:Carrier domain-containing protein n=1 Tax=Streptomyces roseochromogenus subsp. oscitans DS 12.976 TaxID=1352936 RepID=V6KS38_STRRC|nr:acyl carrier protein [Streptomyces roseochromogenus]EST34211.1 hypothetical protein M878_11255 [Streptomyces roseochromogenus subsp. oscitans DS 12.976]